MTILSHWQNIQKTWPPTPDVEVTEIQTHLRFLLDTPMVPIWNSYNALFSCYAFTNLGVHINNSLPTCPAGCWQCAINLLRLRRKKRTTGDRGNLIQTGAIRVFHAVPTLQQISPSENQKPPWTTPNQSGNTNYRLATTGCIRSNIVDKSWAKCAWHHV